MFGDSMGVVISILLSLMIWSVVGRRAFTFEFVLEQAYWFFMLVAIWFVLASANDFYELRVAASRAASLQRVLAINFQMIVVYLIIYFLSPPESLPRLFILYYGMLSFLLITIWRLVNPALMGWAVQSRRVLIIGTDWAAETIIDALRENAPQTYEIAGAIGETETVGQLISDVPVLGVGEDILNYVLRDDIRELVVTSTRELRGEVFQGVMDSYERGVSITPMPILYERITGRVPVQHVDNNWSVVLPIGTSSQFDPYPFLKRIIDVVVSLLLFGLFLLLLPFMALAIRLDSKGSIFFTQTRVGLNGRFFKIVKFRTMVQDAEKETGAVFAQKNDPRVTRVGNFLRKTRVDELPQLINVLRGDMSLVGPRPERPEHVRRLEESIPFYRTRHVVRPGVTGWAQVRYHYGSTDKDAMVKLQYDLYYIRHQSISLDINILIRTVGKVLKMSGQ